MTTNTKSTVAAKWESVKPKITYLVIGLIAGPVLTNFAGWQVLSGTADDRVRAGIVEQQAMVCAAGARTEVADTSKLDYSARNELAKKWAIMPGATAAETEVTTACAKKLAG